MAEIGKILDVNRSLIAYHFPQKENLFFQISEYIVNDLTKFLESSPEKAKNFDELIPQIERYFSLNHHYLVTFVNFLYYCGIEYRYFGQYKELLNYFKMYSNENDSDFVRKVDSLIGKLVRMGMEIKYK
jgi:AcrR family transcriptional regulator